ncbi:MAG: hypothetical protein V3S24_12500, partial [Candidatus Tectomicrobia bacterium]
ATYNAGTNTLTFDGTSYAANDFQFTVNALADTLVEGGETFTNYHSLLTSPLKFSMNYEHSRSTNSRRWKHSTPLPNCNAERNTYPNPG